MKHIDILKALLFATLTTIATFTMIACQDSKLPPVTSKELDCAFHVVNDYVGGHPDLIDQVIRLSDKQSQVEEFISVLVDLGRSDAQIVDAGHALLACYPGVPVPESL